MGAQWSVILADHEERGVNASELLDRINSQGNYHCLELRRDNSQCGPCSFSKHELLINMEEQSHPKDSWCRCICFDKEKVRGYNNKLAEGLKGINFLGQCLLGNRLPCLLPSTAPQNQQRQSSQYIKTIVFITVSRLPYDTYLKQNTANWRN